MIARHVAERYKFTDKMYKRYILQKYAPNKIHVKKSNDKYKTVEKYEGDIDDVEMTNEYIEREKEEISRLIAAGVPYKNISSRI